MAAYTKESSELLQKLATIDLDKLQTLHIRIDGFITWLQEKRDVHMARLLGDTPWLADLAQADVYLMQLVSHQIQ
jgi:hypothetical protein